MIASLRGTVIAKELNSLVLETGGVGYRVLATPEVVAAAQVGEALFLHTYLQVREDAMVLFGFTTQAEQAFFELLISVSGVGPKMALTVLSSGNADMVKDAIAAGDVAVFTKIGGVGRKTAEKIIVELKDKIGALGYGVGVSAGGDSDMVLAALEQFGYSAREIKEILPKLDHAATAEDRIRQALKLLGR
jgi:Holliday junction DNA helicase RuvA